MRSTPAWSSTSQPVKPAPPTVFGAISVPLMMSSNDEPESASVSCQRSRLTTTWIGRPTRLLLISMSSSAPTVSYWWKAQSKPPAPALRSMAAFWRHQVVAALGVVVVLAGLTDEDVVAGSDLRRVVEERRTVVALQQVLTGSALDPVVATVAEDGVGALTGDDEVVAGTGEGLVVVGSAVDEVLAVAADDDVVAGACRRGRRCRGRP